MPTIRTADTSTAAPARPTATPRQRQIVRAIHDLTVERGYPPTVREVAATVGLRSSSTVHLHLTTLVAEDWIVRDATIPRSLRLTARGWAELHRPAPQPSQHPRQNL